MHYKTKKLLNNIRDAIVNPKSFFKKIVADGDLEESMLMAFIYGLIGGALVLLFRLIGGATITIGIDYRSCVGGGFVIYHGRIADADFRNYRWRTRLGNRNQRFGICIFYVSCNIVIKFLRF